MVGTTISHYEILEKIGQGGMGEVFLAQDTSLDRKVALKFLPDELQQDPTARKRFLREAKSAAALDHPYICKIYEVGEAEKKSFISMEYLEGETLTARGKSPAGRVASAVGPDARRADRGDAGSSSRRRYTADGPTPPQPKGRQGFAAAGRRCLSSPMRGHRLLLAPGQRPQIPGARRRATFTTGC